MDLKKYIGGTLVEYLDGAGFDKEWGRANILDVREDDDDGGVAFVTDGRAHYEGLSFKECTKYTIDEVLYFDPDYLGFVYAVAPPGVNIPTPSERMKLVG